MVSGGVLQIWRVQMRPGTSKGTSSTSTSISKKKTVEFGLAPIRDSALPPSITEQLFPQPSDPEPMPGVYGEWLPRSLPSRKTGPAPAPLSFSEIETNPPYQPFYTDRRVTRFIYSRPFPETTESSSDSSNTSTPLPPPASLAPTLHHSDDSSPWLFGQPIDALRVSSNATTHGYDSGEGDDDLVAGVAARIENKLVLRDGEEEVEQVVVTTRRRRVRREGGEEDEEGFFEDDCEVLDFAEDRV